MGRGVPHKMFLFCPRVYFSLPADNLSRETILCMLGPPHLMRRSEAVVGRLLVHGQSPTIYIDSIGRDGSWRRRSTCNTNSRESWGAAVAEWRLKKKVRFQQMGIA